MMNLFKLVPPDVTDFYDVTMRNRWYTKPDSDRLYKARELRVRHDDLGETYIPMKWDSEARTWIEDKSASRMTFAGRMTTAIDPTKRDAWVQTQMEKLKKEPV